ncbi:MAG: ATP-grasp domain-containing protein [Prevotella sp.]|nr:ATP-grasp domain-containing protein [Prevotella sp.]
MKKLLVLAAGILQIPVIKKAREMGYHVIAADGNPEAIGLPLADKAIVANIIDEEEMLRIAREEQIDGVIHPCSEVSMNVMGRINNELGLSGITRETAIQATNKHLMREAFEQGGAPSPKSCCTADVDEAWDLFCEEFTGSAILKPSRNSGSRGVAKIQKSSNGSMSFGQFKSASHGSSGSITKEEFLQLYDRALAESRDQSVMIEQFIEGPEFSVEVIVWQGVPHVLTVTDKKTTEAPYFVELGHNQPSLYPDEIQKKLKEAAVKGIKALGLNNCAAHCELKIQDGEPYLMEIGARLGGDFISTELTHLSTGVDMVAAAINVALGEEPDLNPKDASKGVCIRYFTPTPGKLVAIKNEDLLNDSHVYDAEIYHQVGDVIPEVRSSLDRSGHVIVTHDTVQQAIALADKIVEGVEFAVEKK